MKKILRLRVLVAVLFTAFGVSNSFAQSDIDEQLVFLGITMTKDNGNSLDSERKWVKSGSVKYDADTRTITLPKLLLLPRIVLNTNQKVEHGTL